jgi:hypothetical protein
MSAARALARAQAAGLRLCLRPDGGVRVEAEAAPPAEVLADLRRWRDDIARLLAARARPYCPTDPVEPPLDPEGLPFTACPACGAGLFWKDAAQPFEGPGWACEACHPAPAEGWRHAVAVPT